MEGWQQNVKDSRLRSRDMDCFERKGRDITLNPNFLEYILGSIEIMLRGRVSGDSLTFLLNTNLFTIPSDNVIFMQALR